MKVLVFGRTGQVARELVARCPEDLSLIVLGRDQADLEDPVACARWIEQTDVNAVINAAAYTGVDAAESDEPRAARVNAEAPGAMAEAAAHRGLPFVHISTDYVFDGGAGAPWTPESTCAPINAYGRTKLAGERNVAAAGGNWAVLRTSWVFSSHGSNFVKTMLRLAESRDCLQVVADQVGGPTPAADIAWAALTLVRQLHAGTGAIGVHHFSGAPDTSWAGFARAVLEAAGKSVIVEEISTDQYPTPARRPLDCRLDCATTRQHFGIDRPDWRSGLANVLSVLDMAAGQQDGSVRRNH